MYVASIEIGSSVEKRDLSLGYSSRYQEIQFNAGGLRRRIAGSLNEEPYIRDDERSKDFIYFVDQQSISESYPDIVASAFYVGLGSNYNIGSDRSSFIPMVTKTDKKRLAQPVLCYVIIDKTKWSTYYLDISKEMNIMETFHYNEKDGFLISVPGYSETEKTAEHFKIVGYRPEERESGNFPSEFQSFDIAIHLVGSYPNQLLKITATELEVSDYERNWFRSRWERKPKNLILRVSTKNKVPFLYVGSLPRTEANEIIAKHIKFNGGSHLVTEGYDYKYIQILGLKDSRDPRMVRQEAIDKLKPVLDEYRAHAIAILGDYHITLAESKLLRLNYIIKILRKPTDGSLKMTTVKSN